MWTTLVGALQISQELLLEFFMGFARFEYALKAAGYAQPRGANGVDVDWDSFAREIAASDPAEIRRVCLVGQYLLEQPPRLQVLRHGELQWAPRARLPDESDLAYLIRCVRGVRNNLFHGGKFAQGSVENPARNEQLLRSSLDILRMLLELPAAARVKQFFYDMI